jgi:hypothetical protein
VKTSAWQPSGIGELLDRAIATYLRHFAGFFAILAAVAIPIAVLQMVARPEQLHTIEDIQRLLTAQDVTERQQIIAQMSAGNGWTALVGLAGALAYALSHVALIGFAARILDGRPASIPAAYRIALARWLPAIIVGIAFIAIGMVVIVPLAIVVVILGTAIGVLAQVSVPAAIATGVVFALVAGALFIALSAAFSLAWEVSVVGVATGETNPIRAVGQGLRRTFDRRLLRRTLLVALALLVVEVAGSLAFILFGGLLAALAHSGIVYVFVASVGSVLIDGVAWLFVLVYTRDLIVRREGLDLLPPDAGAPLPA